MAQRQKFKILLGMSISDFKNWLPTPTSSILLSFHSRVHFHVNAILNVGCYGVIRLAP
jgi:hypothetical protein